MPSKYCTSYALLLLLLVSFSSARLVAVLRLPGHSGAEQMVGGRLDVQDVESNREVQELGLFCVEEHNRRGFHLVFSKVVAAQTQVVSGIKYYLRIAARDGVDADEQVFYAVIVVKAWMQSRDLVSFAPAGGS